MLADPPLELDLVAFVTDAEEKVLSDSALARPPPLSSISPSSTFLKHQAARVRLETGANGESRLAVDLDELSLPGVRGRRRCIPGRRPDLRRTRACGTDPARSGRRPVGTDRRGRWDNQEQPGAGCLLSTRRPVTFPASATVTRNRWPASRSG